MKDNKKINKGIFAQSVQSTPSDQKKKRPIDFEDTWRRESVNQPGLMIEVLNITHSPFRTLKAEGSFSISPDFFSEKIES